MVMRLVHIKIKSARLPDLQLFYEQEALPALQGTPGCLYACLIRSVHHADECVSLTLWETQEHAERYAEGGVFQQLSNKLQPFLAESNEWKIQLTSDLKLDYQPMMEEPVVESHQVTTDLATEKSPLKQASLFYLRIFSMKVLPDKHQEMKRIYHSEIIPALLRTPGCLYAYLTEGMKDNNEFFSITIWNSKRDADTYEAAPLFTELKEKLKHTFFDMIQWRMGLSSEQRGRTVTSDDVAVKGYTFVTGKSFR